MRSKWIGAAVALALVFALPGAATAREVLRAGFDGGPLPGRDGAGWSQVDPERPIEVGVAIAGAVRGGISFDLQRRADGGAAGRGAVFGFRDKDGKLLVGLSVVWSSEQEIDSRLILVVPPRGQLRGETTVPPRHVIPLGRQVLPGQWVHVEVVWDDDQGKTAFYADGVRLTVLPAPTYPRASTLDPGSKEAVLLAEGRQTGRRLPFLAWPLGDLLPRAVGLRWGEGSLPVPLWASGDNPVRPPPAPMPLSNAVVDNFVVVVDEPLESLHAPGHDVKALTGAITKDGVLLTWAPPELHGIDQKYLVYRRAGEGQARFERLSAEPVRELRFLDATAVGGHTYRYSVTSAYGDLQGGTLEGKYPPEVSVTAAAVAIDSVAAEKALYGAGQEVVVTLRGTKDLKASFQVAKAPPVAMEEVDDGVYVGRGTVPEGVNLAQAALTGTLTDPAARASVTRAGPPVGIDTKAPEGVPRVIATVPWGGEVLVSWDPSPSADVDHYGIYRGEGREPSTQGQAYAGVKGTELVDTRVIPGLEYRYAIVPVDKAGNRGPASLVVQAKAVPGDGPRISAVTLEPGEKPLKPGQVVTVTAVGQSGGQMTADAEGLAAGLVLTEEGRSGRYVGTYTVRATDVGPTKSAHRVIVHLADAYGKSDQGGPELRIVGTDSLNDKTPPAIGAVSHDGFQAAGISGKLVAGDALTVTLTGEPWGYGSFDLSGVAKAVPLQETAPGSGVYQGRYTIPWGASGEKLTVTGHLVDDAGNESLLAAEGGVSLDTRVRLAVNARESLLPADRKSQTKLTARATDANGKGLVGHELVLTLSTTEEYTGVVGGGSVEGRQARKDDEDNLEVQWGGKTDGFGEVAAAYTAGFAAKTALILAKDLTTGDVGAGWLHTYLASQVALELVPRGQKGTQDRALLRLSADPAKLTADGRSTSRVRAWLTDLQGVPLKGVRLAFALAGDNGRLKVLQAATDGKGMAEAEYRAGTAMGTVTVTASSQDYGVTGSVPIILMSDAPAKLLIAARPAKLAADGTSQSAVGVRVTDIHDNPNQEVPVVFTLLQPDLGSLTGKTQPLTDRNGEAQVGFRAGTKKGVAIVEARYTSRAPTEQELRRVYGTVFVPRWYERQERDRVRLVEWLVQPGEKVEKGQTLVTVETKDGEKVLSAPAKGVFVRKTKHERDELQPGDTLGYVEIDPEAWKEEYGR